MQQAQYEALVRLFTERAELEEQLLPVTMQVYAPTAKTLTNEAHETDEQRTALLNEVKEFLQVLGAECGLAALFGDPDAKAILTTIAIIVTAIEVATLVANASVVAVTLGSES